MLAAIIAGAGIYAFRNLTVEAFPDPTDTQVQVITLFPGQPTEPPYVYAFIMLDGADVQFPHILGEVDLADIRVGMRVKAVWAAERKGTLHDIEYFKPVKE